MFMEAEMPIGFLVVNSMLEVGVVRRQVRRDFVAGSSQRHGRDNRRNPQNHAEAGRHAV